MYFEWDEKKNQQNIKKHGIDFETAIRCWEDQTSFDIWDEAHSTSKEMRWLKFGRLPDGKACCVVFTEVSDDFCRIISAFSDKKVEEIYYEGIHVTRG